MASLRYRNQQPRERQGNIKTESDLEGSYRYDSSRPHAMTTADGNTFGYDANGNMLSGADRTITWSFANLPTRITKANVARYFHYGPDRARFKQILTGSGPTETTRYVGGLYEQISKGSVTTRRHHIYANGQVIGVYSTQNNNAGTVQYLHRDHLGSVDTITNYAGQVVERLSYDAWGRRRNSNWTDFNGQLTASFNRGFTGHEHLDDVRLIHMNGRVYHPGLGRFISADPTVQFPKASQSLNRYGYVLNNPLSYTDPSGFGIFSEILQFQHTVDPVARGFDNILAKSSTLQSIGGVAAGVASVYFGPWVAAAYSAHLTNIQGGSTGDIVKAGAIAGGAAAASGAAGGLGTYGQIAANIAMGTAAGVASGADFDDSFYASAFTAAAAAGLANIDGNTASARLARITVGATIGGTASELSGGKFANGAQTAAFLYASIEAAEYFESGVGGEPSLLPGENRPDQPFYEADANGRQLPQDRSINSFGNNESGHICSQGSACSKAFNLFPGASRGGSRVHDYWLNSRKAAGLTVTEFYNVGTMPAAAVVGYAAIIGRPLQALSTQQLIYLSISSSLDRDDRQSIYGLTFIGAR